MRNNGRRLAIRAEPSKAALTARVGAAMAGPMQVRKLAMPLGLGLLSACGGSGRVVQSTPPPGRLAAPVPLHPVVPGLRVQNLPGLEGVIGETAPQLTRQFGPPRLTVIEGDVRKLQFSGTACVLDVYLYPAGPGQVPQAGYVDARRGDGKDVDRAACVTSMRRAGVK